MVQGFNGDKAPGLDGFPLLSSSLAGILSVIAVRQYFSWAGFL